MHDKLTTIVINTDSAYTTANGLITIPRTGVYRLGGFVNILYSVSPVPRVHSYVLRTLLMGIIITNLWLIGCRTTPVVLYSIITTILPCPTVSLVAGDQLGIQITTNLSCSTTIYSDGVHSGCGLQVEFLY